jgi:hypothetical protein
MNKKDKEKSCKISLESLRTKSEVSVRIKIRKEDKLSKTSNIPNAKQYMAYHRMETVSTISDNTWTNSILHVTNSNKIIWDKPLRIILKSLLWATITLDSLQSYNHRTIIHKASNHGHILLNNTIKRNISRKTIAIARIITVIKRFLRLYRRLNCKIMSNRMMITLGMRWEWATTEENPEIQSRTMLGDITQCHNHAKTPT